MSGDAAEPTFFEQVGGHETFRRLVAEFYRGVAGDPVLRPLYPEEDLVIEVVDDGTGFDPDLPRSGTIGLTSMRERAQRLGGELTIESQPGAGTQLCLRVP